MVSGQFGLGGSRSDSVSQDALEGTQAGVLRRMFNQAANASQENTVAGFDPLQLQAQQQAIDTSGNLQPFVDSALQSNQFLSSGALLDPSTNPFTSQVAEAATRPIFQNLTENVLPSIRGDAALTGNVGGSRQGIAEGLASRGALDAAGDVSTGVFNNAFNQGIQGMISGLGLSPQTANLGLLPANILEAVGGERQALSQSELDMPFRNLSMLAQILGDPIVLNRSTGKGRSIDHNSGGSFLGG